MNVPRGTLQQFIDIYGLEQAGILDSMPEGTSYWRGGTIRDPFGMHAPRGYELQDAPLSDSPYRNVYVCYAESCVITYCEGDISVEQLPTDAECREYVIRLQDFYRLGLPLPVYSRGVARA